MNNKYGTCATTGWHCINIIYPQEEEEEDNIENQL
jgi:hypothetical protein